MTTTRPAARRRGTTASPLPPSRAPPSPSPPRATTSWRRDARWSSPACRSRRYNGTFKVDSVISATQFTYTAPASGLAASGGGNVALPPQPNIAQSWDDWGPSTGRATPPARRTGRVHRGDDGQTRPARPAASCPRRRSTWRSTRPTTSGSTTRPRMMFAHDGELPPRRRRRSAEPDRVRQRPGPVQPLLQRRLAELLRRLPEGIHHPLERAPAERLRGQQPRGVAAPQRHPGHQGDHRLHLERPDDTAPAPTSSG